MRKLMLIILFIPILFLSSYKYENNNSFLIVDHSTNETLAGVKIQILDKNNKVINEQYSDLYGRFSVEKDTYKMKFQLISYDETVVLLKDINENVISLKNN